MSYLRCFFLLGIVASGIWIGILTLYHFFDFTFLAQRNQFERFARSFGTGIRQTWLVNNGHWVVFFTMTILAFAIGIWAQFARPTIIAQGQMEIRKEISKRPLAQQALNFLWEGEAREDTQQEKSELEKERKELDSTGWVFLPWFTCAGALLVWTFSYFFFAISDEVAEVARNLSERLGHGQSAGGHAAEGMWASLRELWLARQARQQPAPAGQQPAQPGQNPVVVQPSLLTIAGMAISTDFLFAFIEHLWHAISHRYV